jgi:D-serine dehydratase
MSALMYTRTASSALVVVVYGQMMPWYAGDIISTGTAVAPESTTTTRTAPSGPVTRQAMTETTSGLDAGALSGLAEERLDDSHKGIPLGTVTTLGDIGRQGWKVSAGDLSLPVTTLYADALTSNLATMARYCERNGVSFAPHGKTTMAPQLFDRQLRAGAWALTCATPTQAAVMRRFGAQRIIVANQVTERSAWRWLAAELAADPELEVLSLVDSVAMVELVDGWLDSLSPTRTMDLLLEVGVPGGRGGVRSPAEARAVAAAVAESRHLRLVGVEGYEGLAASGASDDELQAVDAFIAQVRQTTVELASSGLLDAEEIVVTAGGSAYFDRVVSGLTGWGDIRHPVRVVLRSGCYLSQDAGQYETLSPLAGRAAPTETLRLQNALTAWAAVLTRPEPDLVILGAGKRDLAHDLTLPTARTLYPTAGGSTDLRGRTETFKLMDQHLFLRLDASLSIAPGDIVALDCSHPCTAFDKTTLVPIIDRDNTVVDAVRTFF